MIKDLLGKKKIVEKFVQQPTYRAKPMLGYHDHECVVTFSGGSMSEQLSIMDEVRSVLAKSNMWAYPPKPVSPNVWSINYGYDSGD